MEDIDIPIVYKLVIWSGGWFESSISADNYYSGTSWSEARSLGQDYIDTQTVKTIVIFSP